MNLIIKGFIIGVAKILPGISGSVLAISMGEYKNIISSFNNLKNKDNVFYLFKVLIGLLLSIVLVSKFLFKYIDIYKFYMFSFFVGLILGTIPKMVFKINKNNYYMIIIGFVSLSLISLIRFDYIFPIYLSGFLNGVIESISTIVPGISGTAIMTNLGLYKVYLFGWSNMFDYSLFVSNLAYFVPFLISVFITSIILLKLFYYFYLRYENKFDGLILGFVIASISLLLKNISIFSNIFIFIIFLVIGFIISYFLDKI